MTSPNQIAREVVLAGHRADENSVLVAFDHSEELVREAAVGAWERMGRLNEDDVSRFLNDHSARVRRRALEAASTSRFAGSERLAQEVTTAIHDPDPLVAEVAAFALGELGVASDSVVVALGGMAVTHDDPLCRESAVAALGALESGLDVILRAMGDIATVRRRAVIALSPFDGPEVEAALVTAMEDRDWQVRQAAEDQMR